MDLRSIGAASKSNVKETRSFQSDAVVSLSGRIQLLPGLIAQNTKSNLNKTSGWSCFSQMKYELICKQLKKASKEKVCHICTHLALCLLRCWSIKQYLQLPECFLAWHVTIKMQIRQPIYFKTFRMSAMINLRKIIYSFCKIVFHSRKILSYRLFSELETEGLWVKILTMGGGELSCVDPISGDP